jgi:hypothetical protein
MKVSRQLAVARPSCSTRRPIAVLILQLLPAFADDVITNVMSPVVSYQYYDSFGEDTNASVVSPIVSYQFYDVLNEDTNSEIVSPIVSYQYFDSPDASSVNFLNSPVVSYYYPFLTSPGSVILHGRVMDANGTPLSDATVSAMIYLSPVAQANTDANGNYQMPSLSAGAYDLSAWDSTHQTSMRGLTLNANTAEQDFQLALMPSTPKTVTTNRQPSAFVFPAIGALGETLEIFNGSVFTNINAGNAPSPNLMTIVLTHGFNSDPTVWAQGMASNLVGEGVTTNIANIIAWDWRYAAQGVLPPDENTPSEGVALGRALQTVLGANYSQPIHFMGHSIGTIVNAAAANYLHGEARRKFAARNFSTELRQEYMMKQASKLRTGLEKWKLSSVIIWIRLLKKS